MRKSGILSKQYMCRGLFQRGIWFFSSCPEVELETVTVNVSIQDFVADVVSELVFRNMSQVSKETMFIFPLNFNTVVHTFYASMGDTRTEAMVLEKEEAQQLCKATSGVENLTYLQDQGDLWGPVFACFLGTLPPNREVTISLCYVQELTLQPDGAAQFCWPRELFPSRKYINWISLEEETSKSLHFGICLRSGHGVSHIAVNSSHTPLQYIAPDQTSAEVTALPDAGVTNRERRVCSLLMLLRTPQSFYMVISTLLVSACPQVSLKLPPWMQDDLNLLVYYRGSPSLSAVVERRDPKASPGSLLGNTVVMVTLMPNIPDTVPNPGQFGEFLFLMDRSLFQDAQLLHLSSAHPSVCSQNTLLFLLKSLPLGCYFNIYSFGATFKAFYPQSVEYTQESMDNAVGSISSICPDLGGCDLLGLLRFIYSTPLLHGHPRQLFIFIQRKVSNEEEAVMAEVYRYRDHHRCFCFPTNSCDSFNLSQAMALETKGECVCIHSRMDMTSEAVKCLQQALQPLASGISLHWDLPPGLEVSMIRKAPEMIFQGHQSSIYAQIHGQAQVEPRTLCPCRLPVHRMAMKHLLWKLAWEGTSRAEKDVRHSTVKSSLSLGVLSPFTSVVAVRMKQRDAWHHDSLPPGSSMSSLSCNLVPCQLLWLRGFRPGWFKSTKFWMVQKCQSCLETLDRKARDTEALTQFSASCKEWEPSPEDDTMEEPPAFNMSWNWTISPLSTRLCDFSGLRVVVALQKANGSWAPTAALASALGLSKADVEGQRPSEVVQPTAWATVLALVWLHQYKWKVSWSDLLRAKACRWLQDQEGRIIGGQEARPHSRRYMAYVSIGSRSGTSNCGGFLIHPYAVLSAAHCVAGKTGVNITVTLGAHNIKKEELSQQKFHIGRWVIHPNYSGDTLANDIMLLKLKPKAKLTKQVNRVPLPRHNEHIKQGTRCKVAGWGWTSTTRDKTSVLMEVDLKVQSEDICEKSFKKNYLRESMICCGDEDGKKSTSRGDSGGPLVCNGKAHGIVSYGHKNRIFPKVFTRVSYFEPWIRKELRKFALQDLPDSPSSY
ncbi:von Willebrand factor A domain-containing protein 5A isoform X3 [Columba livia]|uniref:von Willebrand factor A domain-containing protein 5A isoform X3 n=1 Tax=Columba livia TaxID=8932 RepID=UPI0031BB498B